MKRFLFLALIAAPCFAQWRPLGRPGSELTGFFGVGGSTAINPLGRSLDPGWNVAGGVGFAQGYTGVMLDAMVTGFGINDNTLARQGARSGYQRFWAITVDPIVHVNPRGPADFYVTAGAGLYGRHTLLRSSAGGVGRPDFDLVRTDNLYGFGVNGGAGFAFTPSPYSRMKVFVEARYHHMFREDQGMSFVPVYIGVRF